MSVKGFILFYKKPYVITVFKYVHSLVHIKNVDLKKNKR